MLAEPFIIFFLLLHLRKVARTSAADSDWPQIIRFTLFGVIGLFVLDIIFSIELVTQWIWHLLLLTLIAVPFVKEEFSRSRTLMNAILPFAILSFISDILKTTNPERYKSFDAYLTTAIVFSVIWMVAMIFVSRKQQKALQKEYDKTKREEEEKKIIAERKAELEEIVTARTAELRQQKEQVEHTLAELKTTQAQLIQSEKMASLGELTAGIAHEIQNPLNFVNNFSEVSKELIDELKEEKQKPDGERNKSIEDDLLSDISQNLEKIIVHGKRADAIVKAMLQHSRKNTGQKEPTDINALVDEYLRLSYHGLRAKDKSFNAVIKTDYDESLAKIALVQQDIGRVLLNLFNNAFYAVKTKAANQAGTDVYQPAVNASTKHKNGMVIIRISDNGNGIPQAIVDKIFQPFFTTKPTGEGTGLGLSLSYDIIKAHGGKIDVTTKENEGTAFTLQLPL